MIRAIITHLIATSIGTFIGMALFALLQMAKDD